MPVFGEVHPEQDEVLRQVDRMISSNVLHGSESLCKLLRFLTEKSLEDPTTPLKEYQIATQVFGRPSYFDPRLDSTVRVQTGRLRSKLAEYYAGPGIEDPVVIELPKGSYAVTLHFRRKAVAAAAGASLTPEALSPSPVTVPLEVPLELAKPAREGNPKRLILTLATVSAVLAIAVLALVYAVIHRPMLDEVVQVTRADPSLKLFWSAFIDEQDYPWAVFSNAEFVGRPETGLRYFNPAIDPKESILDHYSGVGEVIAVHELDLLFASLGHGLLVKRGRLLSLDDAKNHDLIFLGSSSENLPLREIPTAQDFVFRRVDAGGRPNDLAIVNVHPRSNEQAVFMASQNLPLTEDYSVVALVPGMNPTHWVLLLAGTTTLGTQAAVEYVCHPNTVRQILQRLPGFQSNKIVPFEALLKVRVLHGVPVAEELIALHRR